jgi:hypothetical protein
MNEIIINNVSDLKNILLNNDIDDINSDIRLSNCNINVFLIFLKSARYEERTITEITIYRDIKSVILSFDSGLTREFYIQEIVEKGVTLLMSNDICIFQKENIRVVEYLLNYHKNVYLRHWIKELEDYCKDYSDTLEMIKSHL